MVDWRNDSSQFQNIKCINRQKCMLSFIKRWWWVKRALLKWNSNQKSTFDWYCFLMKWIRYECFVCDVRRVRCVRCVSLCVFVFVFMEINNVLRFVLNFWFEFDNFSFRIFQLEMPNRIHAILRKNFDICGLYAILCAFLIDILSEAYGGGPMREKTEEDEHNCLSILWTDRMGIMWWADELKTFRVAKNFPNILVHYTLCHYSAFFSISDYLGSNNYVNTRFKFVFLFFSLPAASSCCWSFSFKHQLQPQSHYINTE